jgi:hypothetical protein
MRKALLALMLMLVPHTLWAQQGNFPPTSSGGGTTIVTSNPATCTAGQTFFNTTTGTTFTCSATNTLTASTVPGVSPLSFGAKWDVKFAGDCNFVATSQTISCPAGDIVFTAADVGKIEFGTTAVTQINSNVLTTNVLSVPLGTITGFISSTSVTVSIAATANCTATNGIACTFAYGTQDDTAALNAAVTAAWATPGAKCFLQLPPGAAFVSAAAIIQQSNNQCMGSTTNGTLADITSTGPVVSGAGMGSTTIIPLPSFNFASCTGGGSGIGCFGGVTNLHAHDFSINGLGQLVGGTQNVRLFEIAGGGGGGSCDGGNTAWNLSFSGFATTTTNSVGFTFGAGDCNDTTLWNINVSSFGSTPCSAAPANNTLNTYGLMCWGGNSYTLFLSLANSGVWNSYGGMYMGSLSGSVAAIKCTNTGGGGQMNSFGDTIAYVNVAPSIQSLFICNVGSGNFNIDGDQLVIAGSAATSQIFFGGGGNVLHIRNSVINAGNGAANNRAFSTSATDKIFDDGGNTWIAGGTNSTILGSFIADGHSLKGVCTGVATASSTLGLYNTGPNVTATTCTSTNIGTGFSISGVRTLQNLVVTATAAGVNASSGVVTVLKNGVSTTITCTIGTGTSCTDWLHSVALADGDLISIQFTTQAADTLAGVKAIVEWN